MREFILRKFIVSNGEIPAKNSPGLYLAAGSIHAPISSNTGRSRGRWLRKPMLTRWFIMLVCLLLLSGCALGMGDPYELGVGLTHHGGSYYLQMVGDCRYPDGTRVLVRDATTNDVLWAAKLHAGNSASPLLIGNSNRGLSESAPLSSLAKINSIKVSIFDKNTTWDNSFDLNSAGQILNGGKNFGDKNITLSELNHNFDKATCG